jgi:hypothetical protein
VPYPLDLQLRPNQVLVAFLLPERLPGETEYDIGALGRDALENHFAKIVPQPRPP